MNTSSKFSNVLISVLFIIFYSLTANAQSGWVVLNSGTGNSLISVQFPTESTGYVIPYVQSPLFKTINSGTNWTQISALPWNARYIDWIDGNTGYYVDKVENRGDLHKTTNGGLNWQSFNQYYYTAVSFVNNNTGFITDMLGETEKYIRKSTNGGVNWSPVWQFNYWYAEQMFSYTGINALNEQTFYISCYFEQTVLERYNWTRIYRTTNGGASMSYFQADTMALGTPICPSVDTAYTIGTTMGISPPDSVFYHIMKGINNSYTRMFTLPYGSGINSMSFPNNTTGYIIVDYHKIYKTTDGASTWNLIYTDSHVLNNFCFINAATGYAVGDAGYIIKTTTGGEAPHPVSGTVRYQDNNQPVSSGYVKALMFDEQTQNVITVDSAGIQSNGTYMLIHLPPVPVDIMAFQDDEEDNHFVPTYYVSTIYWENATEVTADSNLTGIDIGVYRINNLANNMHIGGGVYSAGADDIASLKDAIVYAKIGNAFKGYSISGNTGAYRIDSLSSGTYEVICNRLGFYSGVRPFQLTTFSVDTIDFVLSILLVSIEPNENNIPELYWLSQNYPNPFNPLTNIKFGLPEQSNVKLTVYDILGREVGRLLDKELKAGEYDVTWDASALASGVYFYRLEAGKYVETRKMVLVK